MTLPLWALALSHMTALGIGVAAGILIIATSKQDETQDDRP